jgi:integrase
VEGISKAYGARKRTSSARCFSSTQFSDTIWLYDICHTAATLEIAAGALGKVISDQLGHASISFTLERYSHVLPSIQDEAAAKVEKPLVA